MPKKSRGKRSAKDVLRLPDLDHSRTSVLQSLGLVASKRTYAFAINDFITWYCSEPRLAFGRTVVLRYRYELEARRLAPATIIGFAPPQDGSGHDPAAAKYHAPELYPAGGNDSAEINAAIGCLVRANCSLNIKVGRTRHRNLRY